VARPLRSDRRARNTRARIATRLDRSGLAVRAAAEWVLLGVTIVAILLVGTAVFLLLFIGVMEAAT
jgi:fatty acid desaturase